MKKNIAQTVAELIVQTVGECGCTLWDVEYVKEGADFHLRVTIDKPEGVTIEDCERVHRAIDPLLDEADPIESFYYLEVSSPGLERELKTEAHLLSSVGESVEVRLFAPRDGAKVFGGELLLPAEDGRIAILDGRGETVFFTRDEIAKISTVYVD